MIKRLSVALLALCFSAQALALLPIPAAFYKAAGGGGGGGGSTVSLDATFGDKTNQIFSSATTNFSASTASGSRLIACYVNAGTGDGGVTVTGITVSGSTLGSFHGWTQGTSQTNKNWSQNFVAWAASALSGETITISVTPSATNIYYQCRAFVGSKDMTALTEATDFGTSHTGANTGTSSAANVTTKAAGSWIFGGASWWSVNSLTAASSNTLVGSNAAGAGASGWAGVTRSDEPLSVGTYSVGMTGGSAVNGYSQTVMEILAGP